MGHCTLTDGRWAWPEGLCHYVQEHTVMLPDEFVIWANANEYKVPDILDMEKVKDSPKSFEYWIEWSRVRMRHK